jgi:hypothetical protein
MIGQLFCSRKEGGPSRPILWPFLESLESC